MIKNDSYQTSILQSLSTTNKNNKIGVSDNNNINILKKISYENKNNNAIPEQGQNYGMIRMKIKKDSAPYHFSHVIYTDNNVNINLEAEADNGNDYKPKFCFYDTNQEGYTFYKRWSGYFDKYDYPKRYSALYTNGNTIILDCRDIDTINDEILKEAEEKIKKAKAKKEEKKQKKTEKIKKYPNNKSKKNTKQKINR